MAQVQRLFSSAGLVRDHSDFGTTPNIAPPSNLKNPVFTTYSSMVFQFSEKKEIPFFSTKRLLL
jgi:hypothetical protein